MDGFWSWCIRNVLRIFGLSVAERPREKSATSMKKEQTKITSSSEDTMRAEYDFRGGVRGKHYHAYQSGHTVKIHNADGTVEVHEYPLKDGAVLLAPDVREYFPDSEAVNTALRTLISLVPHQARKKRHQKEPVS
jgi:hypothetical protein